MARGDQRTLTELQHEAARSRTDLADSVNQLRTKVSDVLTDIRERASPEALKAEAGKYVHERAEAWVQRAQENPLRAAAIGIGAGYPLFRVARTIPTPILMVAVGLYLLGTKSGQNLTGQARQALSNAGDKVSDQIGAASDTLNRKTGDIRAAASAALASASDTVSSTKAGLHAGAQSTGAALDGLRQSAVGLAGSASAGVGTVKDRAVDTAAASSDAIQSFASRSGAAARDGVGAARNMGVATATAVRDQAAELSHRTLAATGDFAQKNPLLVGGIGLALGMALASAFPKSDAENNVLGGASAEVPKRASALAADGFDSAKTFVGTALADLAGRAKDEDLTPDDAHAAARDIGRRARAVAERAADAAFGESGSSDPSSTVGSEGA